MSQLLQVKNLKVRVEATRTGYSGDFDIDGIGVCSTGRTLPALFNNLAKATRLALQPDVDKKGKHSAR